MRNKEKKARLCNWHVLWLTIWYGGWDGVLSAGIAAADSPHHVSAITMGTNKAVPGPFPDQTLQLLQEWQSHTIHRVKEEPKTMKGSQNVWVKPSGHLNFKHWWFTDGIKLVFINRGQTSWPDHFESLQCYYLTFTETLKHWCLCFYFSSMRFNPKECWKPFERHQKLTHTNPPAFPGRGDLHADCWGPRVQPDLCCNQWGFYQSHVDVPAGTPQAPMISHTCTPLERWKWE